MPRKSVGQSWNEKYLSGEAKYASLEAAEVLRFRTTGEIRRLCALLSSIGGKNVLQAGCGGGKYSLSLASYGFTATAMDYTFSPLKNIARLSALLEISPGRIRLVCADLERMPFRDGVFDMVFNDGVVEHWLDDRERVEIINKMARLARPGGYVVVYVPNGGHPFYEKWVRTGYPGYLKSPPMTLYDTDKLRTELERAGLKEVQVDGVASFHSFNTWPYRKWLRLPIGALNRYFPLPKKIRCRWGTYLIGTGKK